MSGQCGGERTPCAMGMSGLNELPLQDVEKSPVIEQIGCPFIEEMTAFDQHMLAAEAMNHLGRSPGVRQRCNFDPGKLLCLMHVRGHDQGERKQCRLDGLDCIRSQKRMAALG